MALIRPQGKLTYSHPAKGGVVSALGLSRDWRPTPEWRLDGAEYIEPLNAIGPLGDYRPAEMPVSATGWQVGDWSQSVRWATVSGNPAAVWVEHYDGAAYASSTPLDTFCSWVYTDIDANFYEPNIALHIARYTPPPGQGVPPQVVLGLACELRVSLTGGSYWLDPAHGTWTAGRLSLYIPLGTDDYSASPRQALLHVALGDTVGSLVDTGWIISGGPSARSASQGMVRETWLLESVTDATQFAGSHILVRNSESGIGDWWHCYNECVRLVPGYLQLTMGGCRMACNVSQIEYGRVGGTPALVTPLASRALPGPQWTEHATWWFCKTAATGWVVTAADNISPNGNKPLVTMTPTTATGIRPVLWFVTEDHLPTITVPAGLPADEDTDGDGTLRYLSYTMDYTWQRTRAEAQFYPKPNASTGVAEQPYPTWLERGGVTVNMGWNDDAGTGLAAADMVPLYIVPGGIERSREGETYQGAPMMTVQMGDFIAARMESTCVVDARQAGGQTVSAWFHLCAHRLGLQDAQLSVAAAIADKVIPLNSVPSIPNLDAPDGQTWQQHFDEVCEATGGLRWGWGMNGLFVDEGTPAYIPGTTVADHTIDYDTATMADVLYTVRRTRGGVQWRNCAKSAWGQEGQQSTYYQVATQDDRNAIGQDLWQFLDARDVHDLESVQQRFLREAYQWDDMLYWTGAGRVGIYPDQFVAIGDCPDIGLTVGAVYQVTEATYVADYHGNEFTTEVTARLVYTPTQDDNQTGLGAVTLGAAAFDGPTL